MRRILVFASVILLASSLAACDLGASAAPPPLPTSTPTPHIGPQLDVAVGHIVGSSSCQGGNDQISCQRADPCSTLADYYTIPNEREYFVVENPGDDPLTWFANVTSGSIDISPASGIVPAHTTDHGEEVTVTFRSYTPYHILFQTAGQHADVSVDC